MAEISRRSFVSKTSLGIVAAGAVVATRPFSGRAEAAPVAPSVTHLDEPIVAYLTDLRSGTVRLFHGEREVTVVDHALAQKLAGSVKS